MIVKNNDKKITIIGLDGMAWHILDKLFEYKTMPSLNELCNNSLKGILKSTIPLNSATAWTSIATGVNPGKHGVFGFTTFDSNYHTRILSSRDVHSPRIHEMFSLNGLKSVCINLPLSYPICKLDGTNVITDWLAPNLSYFPDSIEKYANSYKIPSEFLSPNTKNIFNKMYNGTVSRVNTVNKMMRELDWNLFFIVFSEPDQIFHSNCEDVINGEKSSLKIFHKIDETIKLAKELSDLVLVISDHGFSKFEYAVFVNTFLEKMGLVSKTWNNDLANVVDLTWKEKPVKIRMPDFIYQFISKEPIKTFAKSVSNLIFGKKVQAYIPVVDPIRSKAFMPFNTSFGIHVKEETLIDVINDALKKSIYIKDTWRREEIYWGKNVKKAPEIMFLPKFNEGFTRGESNVPSTVVIKRQNWWQHHPDGIFALYDGELKQQWIGNISAYDVVPTILHYFDIPISKYIDGVPIKNFKTKNT